MGEEEGAGREGRQWVQELEFRIRTAMKARGQRVLLGKRCPNGGGEGREGHLREGELKVQVCFI